MLDEQLLRLGRWIADYYLAPLGEVFRTMLPLNAEFKRSISYRITDEGQMALHLGRIVRIISAFATHAGRTSRRIPRPRLSGVDFEAPEERRATSDPEEPLLNSRTNPSLRRLAFRKPFSPAWFARNGCARRHFRASRRHAHHQSRRAEVRPKANSTTTNGRSSTRWLLPEDESPSQHPAIARSSAHHPPHAGSPRPRRDSRRARRIRPSPAPSLGLALRL